MSNWLNKLFSQRVQWVLCSAIIAIWCLTSPWRLRNGWVSPFPLAGLLFAVFGVLVYLRRPSAKLVGTIAFAATVTMSLVISATVTGFRFLDLLATAGAALGVYSIWFMDEENAGADPSEDRKPFLSLVLLLREPRYLDRSILASLASRAWDIELSATDDDESETDGEGEPENESAEAQPENWIVGEPPILVARHPLALFFIHVFDRPYFDDVEKVAEGCVDLRTRKAILDHTAWVAVDLLHWHDGEGDIGQAYRLIASLLAELADDNVVAVVDPAAGQAFPYDPEIEQKLRSKDPLSAFRDQSYVPVIQIAPDDPEMLAAEKTARDRWPEFVAAFESRPDDSDEPFSIKAPFGKGQTREFMWATVTGIENDVIYGILGNEPANIPDLHEGDRVKTTVDQLNDWIYGKDGELVGGFTVKVVMERAKQQSEQARGAADEDGKP